MTSTAPGAACPRCDRALQPGAAFCIGCGLPLGGGAPAVAPAATADGPYRTRAAARNRPAETLPSAFGGRRTAGAGRRIAAFTLDALAVTGVAGLTLAITGSTVYTAIAAGEIVVGLCAAEAIRGVTIGSALVGIRTARLDRPYPPGPGRGLVRSLVTGTGFLGAVVGAWVVVGSSAWDTSVRRQGWNDRAARTMTVLTRTPAKPRRGEPAPGAAAAPYQEPQVRSVRALRVPDDEQFAPSAVPAVAAAPAAATVAAAAPRLVAVAPATIGPATLVVVFDTGQRTEIASPGAGFIGRNPAPAATGDQLIVVQDPEGTVSKAHLRFEAAGETLTVTDTGSTNGSAILDAEGQIHPLAPGQPVLLPPGGRVRIGDRLFSVSTAR